MANLGTIDFNRMTDEEILEFLQYSEEADFDTDGEDFSNDESDDDDTLQNAGENGYSACNLNTEESKVFFN